jgi:hypothetical protein
VGFGAVFLVNAFKERKLAPLRRVLDGVIRSPEEAQRISDKYKLKISSEFVKKEDGSRVIETKIGFDSYEMAVA